MQTFIAGSPSPRALGGTFCGCLPQLSWSQVRKLILGRRVAINGFLCMDEARRVTEGEVITLHDRSLPPPPQDQDVVIRYHDMDLIVVEKPARMLTLRPPSERPWTLQRRNLQPTLDESLQRKLVEYSPQRARTIIWAVHRLDRDTSGLVMFALRSDCRRHLLRQFARRDVTRLYRAIVPGDVETQSIRSTLVRDRGDGLRGSRQDSHSANGQIATTHVMPHRKLGEYTELQCRLETGRTNQIRIHLAERGHPICGDIKYRGPLDAPDLPDASGAPRLALHAAHLAFVHPRSEERLQFDSDWPADMRLFLDSLV